LAAFALLAVATVRAPAQTVTISKGEFDRLVYSAHLFTVISEKPELEASLQTLLELHRRNPNSDPAQLARALSNALELYRTKAPAYIRTSGFRDEILAAYLEAFSQVPERTNFVPANFTLLNTFMLGPGNYNPSVTPAILFDRLIDSGNQRLFSSEGAPAKRQALLNTCTRRAGANSGFAEAMDRLLYPEIHCSLTSPAEDIIGSPDSPLHGDITMSSLLASNAVSPNHSSLTISSNDVKRLFAAETQSLWDIARTNLDLTLEFNWSQPDLTTYLADQGAQSYWSNRMAEARQQTQHQIACSTAAVFVQSQLTDGPEASFKVPEWVGPVCNVVGGLATLAGSKGMNSGPLISSIPGMLGLFDTSESPDEQIIREIGNIKLMIGDLSTNMNYRFDRVDQSLTDIFDTLNQQMEKIEIIDARTVHISDSVDNIRTSLVNVQRSLNRLERDLFEDFNYEQRSDLDEVMNGALFYELRHPSSGPMDWDAYSKIPDGPENKFLTHATSKARGTFSSPLVPADQLADSVLYEQLNLRPLDANLSYIKQYLGTNRLTAGTLPLANPRDWFAGAYAYLQLAVENPNLYRWMGLTMPAIITEGQNVTNFLRSLTFAGANINTNLYTSLLNLYSTKLNAFGSLVAAKEDYYASTTNFALNPWRPWDVAAPRVATTNTLLQVARPGNLVAAGGWHSLVVKADGRVAGWGDNLRGQCTAPPTATNVVAIAAGGSNSLALRADGVVIPWGSSAYDQTIVPIQATNVIAIAVGHCHSLALRADGCVVAWGAGTPGTPGFPNVGQATVPEEATTVIAIAAGGYHSLALKADGTLLAWGLNNEGQLDIPPTATNVVAIAAGHGHNLALKRDGTLVAWGNSRFNGIDVGITNIPSSATNIVAIAAAGWHCLAQRADGTLLGWGENSYGQTSVPGPLRDLSEFAAGLFHSLALKADQTVVCWGNNGNGQSMPRGWVASPRVRNHIAAGGFHSLALKADGTVVGWGAGLPGHTHLLDREQATIPSGLNGAVAIEGGSCHSLALKANGTVVAWGWNEYHQTEVPTGLANVVAIAAGSFHSLALKADGTVAAWGINDHEQSTVPSDLGNVVAIAAGFGHSLALRANGTVAGWGYNNQGQLTIPTGLSDVVAIAAGDYHSMALKADGTVVVWGSDAWGPMTPPAGLRDVVAISANQGHNLALKSDGTVVAWGRNDYGEIDVPIGLSGVVAIAAGQFHSLALKADGTVVAWPATPAYDYGQTLIPANVVDLAAWGENPPASWKLPPAPNPITQIAAGSAHSLALAADGSVVAWGLNTWGQTNVPPQAQSGAQAVAGGLGHSLVLATNGAVFAWGLHDAGQTNVPSSAQSGVVAISAGGKHNLAIRHDGYVVAWGLGGSGQTNVPGTIQGKVVAIAAGGEHSLALDGYGTVWAWGGNSSGQTSIPGNVTNIVAIAAGRYHNLALTYDGKVRAWGLNSRGQCNVPAAVQTGVVAIAAGMDQSLAIKADGTTVVWGSGSAAFVPLQTSSNVVAIAAGDRHSMLLSAGGAPAYDTAQPLSFVRAQIPVRVVWMMRNANDYVVGELGRDPLHAACTDLSGAKELIKAVLQLGMPYTLERDNVLRGFLYGKESLVDLDVSGFWLTNENARLQATPTAAPQSLFEVARRRYECFTSQINQSLAGLQTSHQPEILRLVGHTLRLLNLLRDAYEGVPPSALEISSGTGSPQLILYGEPYAHYTLQYRDDLAGPSWTSTTITNLHSEWALTPPVSSGTRRFYRAFVPYPW